MSNNIYHISPEDTEKIIKYYKPFKGEIAEKLKHMKEWLENQPHLPQHQDDVLFEMMLRLNKFNLEKSERKLDMYYTVRNKAPEFFNNRSLLSEEMHLFVDTYLVVPLPRLTNDMKRIYIAKIVNSDPAIYDLIYNAQLFFAISDLRLHFDAALGDVIILDMENLRLGHVLKINPLIMRKIYNVVVHGYSDRIKEVHILNMPRIGSTLIHLAKMIVNEKLSRRIYVHKNLEALYEFIPSHLLPCDYGGDEDSTQELYAAWRKAMISKNSWLLELGNRRAKEELRVNKSANDSWFGFFRR